MKRNLYTVVTLVFLVGSVPSLWSQSDRGTITGTVKDGTGAVVASAQVTATNTNTGVSRSTTTTGEGAQNG